MRFGTDEAGKGPVLGSMFAACVVADPDALPDGVADSKRLTPARRDALDAAIRARADAVGVAEIPVSRIDDPETDMNTLTVAAHAEALAATGDEAAGESGVADAGDTSEDRFARRVANRVPFDVDLAAEHGADDEYRLVAAASILAKVARDAHVDALSEQYGDLGSGYPSDPTTRDFLHEYVATHGDLPDCARASWQTSKDALANAEQSGLTDF